jgi:type IX secretion system PorP/SprF family membrane protein
MNWDLYAVENALPNYDQMVSFYGAIDATNKKKASSLVIVKPSKNISTQQFNSNDLATLDNFDKVEDKTILFNGIKGNEINEEESITYINNQNLDDLFEEVSYINEIDDNSSTLNDILGDNSSKYAFLDFKNREGFGWTKSKDKAEKLKSDNDILENLAAISEATEGGEKNTKNRKKLFENFKYIELGLGNINDPIFNVPNNNTLIVNPSLSGELGITRLKTSYRNQWTASNVNSNVATLFADTYFSKIKAGMSLGVNYLNAADGRLENVEYSFSYIQKLKLSKSSNLSVGLTYSLNSINANNISTGEKFEIAPSNYLQLNNFVSRSGDNISNLGVSSWFSGKYFFGGFNVTNLLNNSLTPNQETTNGNYFNELSYNMQIGTDYRKSKFSNTVLSPYLLLSKMAERESLWGGITLRHKAFVLGVSASDDLSAKGLVGVQGNSVRILYGYDISKSEFNQQYIGSHEVSLRILFGNKSNSNWSRYGN